MICAFTNHSLQWMFSQGTVLEATTPDFLALAVMAPLAEAEIICKAKCLTSMFGDGRPDFSPAATQLWLRTSTPPQFSKRSSGDNSSILPHRIAWRSELCKEWSLLNRSMWSLDCSDLRATPKEKKGWFSRYSFKFLLHQPLYEKNEESCGQTENWGAPLTLVPGLWFHSCFPGSAAQHQGTSGWYAPGQGKHTGLSFLGLWAGYIWTLWLEVFRHEIRKYQNKRTPRPLVLVIGRFL